MAGKNDTTAARSYVLDVDALNETKSLEELAELIEGTDKPGADPAEQHGPSEEKVKD